MATTQKAAAPAKKSGFGGVRRMDHPRYLRYRRLQCLVFRNG